MNPDAEPKSGGAVALEGSLECIRSLISRLERLSSPAAGQDGRLIELHEQTFRDWLAFPPAKQLADLQAYFKDSGGDARLALSEACYLTLVPRSAAEVEKRLFSCCLQVALATLQNEHGSARTLSRFRVARTLRLAQQRHGVLTLEEASLSIGTTSRQFARLFTNGSGMTFRRYCSLLRVLRAVGLLRDPRGRVKGIAGALGYADPSNFVREFRGALGVTPNEFRAQLSP